MTPAEVALAYIRSFASGDPEQVAGWVAEDFINNQMTAIGNCFQGRDRYLERLPQFFGRFHGLGYAAEEVIAQGDMVAIPYHMTATDAGHPLSIKGVMVIWVRGDRVARRDDYWDGLTYCQQMGLALPFEQRGA